MSTKKNNHIRPKYKWMEFLSTCGLVRTTCHRSYMWHRRDVISIQEGVHVVLFPPVDQRPVPLYPGFAGERRCRRVMLHVREERLTRGAACPRGTSDKEYRQKGHTNAQAWGIWHSRGRDATCLVPLSGRHTSRHGCIEIWCRYDNPGKGQEMSVKNKNRSMKVPTN